MMRLKERIGGYHKYVDNASINQPDPTSSHYLPDAERFNKDFASHDKVVRAEEHKQKMEMVEKKRVEKFDRDMMRWQFMDSQEQRDKERLKYMNENYQTGKKNKGGAAYNVINLDYDHSNEGKRLQQLDEDSKVRALMRSKNIDVRSNCGYNVLTGDDRRAVDIPQNDKFNPVGRPDSQRLQQDGHQIVHGQGGQPAPYQQQPPLPSPGQQ